MEFCPINPSDLLLAKGIYALRPALPTVIGNEGVGRVLDVGPGVRNVKVGDRVLAPLSSFTWRERMVISADGLFALPPDADPRQLAMLAINPPTAALTNVPPRASDEILCAQESEPTLSTTAGTFRGKGSLEAKVWWAPSALACARPSSVRLVAQTSKPAARPSWISAVAMPPVAP